MKFKQKLAKIIVYALTIANLGYFGSCFYYIKPNQNAIVRRTVKTEQSIKEDDKYVLTTGLHFKWTGIQELNKYETKRDVSLEELAKELNSIYAYKENLKKTIEQRQIITEEQVKIEIEKIARHFKKLGLKDEVEMPEKVVFQDFGNKKDDLAGYVLGNSIFINEIFQKDETCIKTGILPTVLAHEFIHMQGLWDESYTECVTAELVSLIAKEDKVYEYALLEDITRKMIYNMYFLALRDKPLPHNWMDKLVEKLKSQKDQYREGYDYVENTAKPEEKDFFDKSYEKINGALSKVRLYGKKEFVDLIVKDKIPKEEYESFKKRMKKRLETNTFDDMIYEYCGTTYQLIKDAMTDNNTIKKVPFYLNEKDIKIDNLAEELEKVLKK